MRKGSLVFVMVLAVVALANASVPEPVVEPAPAEVTPVEEVLPERPEAPAEARATECGAMTPLADFDVATWLEQDAKAICEDTSNDAWFEVARGGGGQNCGGTICGAFQYCCNPSCGTCVYWGMSCTQQSCN